MKKMYVHDHRGQVAKLIDIIYCNEHDFSILTKYSTIFGDNTSQFTWTDSLEWTKRNYYDHYSRYNP